MMDASSSVTKFTSQPDKGSEPDQQCALLEYKKEGEHYKMPEQVVLKFRSQPFIATRKGKITISTVVLLTLAIAGLVSFLFLYHNVSREIKIFDDQYEIKLNYSAILRKNPYWASLVDFVPSVNRTSHWNLVDMLRGNVTLVRADQRVPFGGGTKWSNHLLYINANRTNINHIMLKMDDLLRLESLSDSDTRGRSIGDFFMPDDSEDSIGSKNTTSPRNKPLPIKPMALQE